MLNALHMQQAAAAAPDVNVQLREQVREQLRAAREQARTAQEQARQQSQVIQDQVRAATQDFPGGGPVIIQPSRPPFREEAIPHEVVQLSIVLFSILALTIITWPIMRAFARRMDRGAVAPASNPELSAQLQRIEQGVEAMSIEVERISEAQRYMARLQTERGAEAPALAPRSPMS